MRWDGGANGRKLVGGVAAVGTQVEQPSILSLKNPLKTLLPNLNTTPHCKTVN